MSPFQQAVQEFHVAMQIPVGDYSAPAVSRPELRAELIREEGGETVAALRAGDLILTVDGLCDVVYVCFGAAVEYGVRLGDLSLRPEIFQVKGKPGLPGGKDRLFWIDLLEKRTAEAVKGLLDIRLGPHGSLGATNALAAGCLYAAADFGIHFADCFEEVHASNMRKAGGPVRADGKRLKPPGWTPPDLRRVLEEQGWKEAA